MDVKVREEARKAARDRGIHAALIADNDVLGAEQIGRAAANAAIDAYEAALESAGYVIAETVESITGRARMMAIQNDEHEKRFRERYAVVPRKLTEEQIDAIHRDWRGLLNEAQVEALYRAMIAATNPAP